MQLLAILENQLVVIKEEHQKFCEQRREYINSNLDLITAKLQKLIKDEVGEEATVNSTQLEDRYFQNQTEIKFAFVYNDNWTRKLDMVFDPKVAKFVAVKCNGVETADEDTNNLLLLGVALGIISKHIILNTTDVLGADVMVKMQEWVNNFSKSRVKPLRESINHVEKLIKAEKLRIKQEEENTYLDSIKHALKKGRKFITETEALNGWQGRNFVKVIELDQNVNLDKARVKVSCFNSRGYYTNQLDGTQNKSVPMAEFIGKMIRYNFQPIPIEETEKATKH